MAGGVRAFQIHYDAASRAALDPDFEPLDNAGSPRPDWYEYWPIREFFRAQPALDEAACIGFFSPLFRSKTGLTGAQVRAFAAAAGEAEVITFSPHPCHGAVFYNVFEQGANCFTGFLDVAAPFVRAIDPAVRLEHLVNDSRNTVYANYFLARPRFWRDWNAVLERLFEMAETPGAPLHAALNAPVRYAKDDGESKPAQMKIMVMERIASLLLAGGAYAVRNYPPFELPVSAPFAGRQAELAALDRLKVEYARSRDQGVLRQYVEGRDRLAGAAWFGKPG